MSKQTINIGASPNDGTGTPLRTSFDYTNQNFTELYTALGGGVGLPGATTQVIFNDGGTNLAGDAGLVYNKTTDALTVGGLVTAGSATITGDLTVDTSTLKVDSTNNRVGIGTATPSVAFEVKKTGLGSVTSIVLSRTTENVTDTQGVVWKSDDLSINYAGVLGVIDSGTAGSLALQTATGGTLATKVTIDGTGNLSLATGNVVMATSGKGIDFSATANSSGTMTSELLNDYEEGTWTPVATGLTNVGAVTYNATYTKIGRVVYINLKVTAVTSTTSVANTTFFSGLPFTPALNSTITAVNEGNITSLGVGLIATGSTVFTPNWTAVQNATISGFYYV